MESSRYKQNSQHNLTNALISQTKYTYFRVQKADKYATRINYRDSLGTNLAFILGRLFPDAT